MMCQCSHLLLQWTNLTVGLTGSNSWDIYIKKINLGSIIETSLLLVMLAAHSRPSWWCHDLCYSSGDLSWLKLSLMCAPLSLCVIQLLLILSILLSPPSSAAPSFAPSVVPTHLTFPHSLPYFLFFCKSSFLSLSSLFTIVSDYPSRQTSFLNNYRHILFWTFPTNFCLFKGLVFSMKRSILNVLQL